MPDNSTKFTLVHNLPGGDMVRQLNGDSLPARAVDSIVDGGFMELEWGTANAVRRGGKALSLNELPGIGPVETKEVELDSA